MSVRRIATVLGLLAVVLPAFVAAQGLGDAAAREKAKRDAAKKAGAVKVITNEDLAQGRPPGTPAAATPATPSAAPRPQAGNEGREESASESDEGSSEEMEGRSQEQAHLNAVTAAQSQVAQVEARIQELQAKLNPMSNSFIYGAFGSNSLTEEAEVRAALTQAEGELNAAREALAAAQRAHQDLRQGRLPPPPGQ